MGLADQIPDRTFSKFRSLEIRRSTFQKYMKFVYLQSLRIISCETIHRVLSHLECNKKIKRPWCSPMSAADVKMKIPVLVWSLKSSILSSTSLLQVDKTLWGVVSAVVKQSRCKANIIARGDGKFGPWGWPQYPSKQTNMDISPSWSALGSWRSYFWRQDNLKA